MHNDMYVSGENTGISSAGGHGLEYRILGPIQVASDNHQIRVVGLRSQRILAMLLLNSNRIVPVDRLVDAAWDEDPPSTARRQVQNRIAALRSSLDGANLVTHTGGYRLAVEPDELDANVFQRLAAAATVEGEVARRTALFQQALALWRGPALAGLDSRVLAPMAQLLEEKRLRVLGDYLDLQLKEGNYGEVIPELAGLIAEHPHQERFLAQWMLAISASGRRAEALDAYHEFRSRNVERQGLEPGQELHEAYLRVLRDEPVRSAPIPRSVVAPAQLPPDIADFAGRGEEIREVLEGVTRDSSTSTAVGLITGPGGGGKTTLVVHIAHLLRDKFPDGQLFVSLRGTSSRPVAVGDALARVLRDLGLGAGRIPEADEERALLFRSQVADKRVLLVLDDAQAAAQVRPLIPASSGCAVLVTSRHRLAGLAGCRRVDLAVLDPRDAQDLFCSIVGETRTRAEASAVAEIVETCGYLPLAVRIAASRLAVRSGWRIEALRQRLADTRRRLDELHVDDLHVRTCFQLSYRTLSRDQAHAFRLLSIVDGDDISGLAAARVLDVEQPAAERLAEALVDVHLLETAESGRYRFHDLLRLFAREEAENLESPADLEAALGRLLDEYADATHAVAILARPGYLTDDHGQDKFPDEATASAWLEAELSTIVTTVIQSTETPAPDAAAGARILHNIQWYLRAHGRWDLWERSATAVLSAALRTGDRGAELIGRQQLGLLAALRGRDEEAESHLAAALSLARALGDRRSEGDVLNRLGLAVSTVNRFDDAIDFHRQALEVFLDLDEQRGQCIAQLNLGKCHLEIGEPDVALGFLVPSLEIARRLDDHYYVTLAMHHMACCQSDRGCHREAIEAHLACLAEVRRAGYREGEAYTFYGMGRAYAALGELTAALGHLRSAHDMFRELGDPRAAGNCLIDLGHGLVRLGDRRGAETAWREALAVFESRDPAITAELHAALATLG